MTLFALADPEQPAFRQALERYYGVRRIRGPSPYSRSPNASLHAVNCLPHTAYSTKTSIGWESRLQIGRQVGLSREHQPQISRFSGPDSPATPDLTSDLGLPSANTRPPAAAGKPAPDLPRPRRGQRLIDYSAPLAGGIRSRIATASSLHRARRGDKASQEGCQRFSEPLPSRCRFCRPKRSQRPRRWILPLTHSESPSLVAVRRPPSGIEPPPAASVLGGGAGFRGAKRGGVFCWHKQNRRCTACPRACPTAGFWRVLAQVCVSLGLFKISI